MDVAALVRAVIAAFEDAAKLVKRIQEQRAKGDQEALPDEPTADLLESLALGPIIVRGHYDHDVKRFGEPYACGDMQAREQMKDVLINLQMTLITTLRSVWMDDVSLDFAALQSASDDCRVNAGVCLGQFAQRLSEQAKAQSHYHQSMSGYSSGAGLNIPLTPSLGYSTSRSTNSSAAYTTPRTPDHYLDQFQNLNLGMGPPGAPHMDRKRSNSSGGSQERYSRHSVVPAPPSNFSPGTCPVVATSSVSESDEQSIGRRSSQALPQDEDPLALLQQPNRLVPVSEAPILRAPTPRAPNPPESNSVVPTPSDEVVAPAPLFFRTSSGQTARTRDRSSTLLSQTNSLPQTSPVAPLSPPRLQPSVPRERFGPDDYGHSPVEVPQRQFSNSTIYDLYTPDAPVRQNSSHSDSQQSYHSTLEHISYLQQNSRPPMMQPRPPRVDSVYNPDHATIEPTGDRQVQPTVHSLANDLAELRRLTSRSSISAPIPVEPSQVPRQLGQSYSPFPPQPLQVPATTQPNSTQSPTPTPTSATSSTLSRASTTASSSTTTPTSPNVAAVKAKPKRQPLPNNSETFSPMSGYMVGAFLIPDTVRPPTDTAIVPSERALLGFCKGAWKLQVGTAKAFTLWNKPVGYASMVQHWKCSKCQFEGPAAIAVNVFSGGSLIRKKTRRDEAVFDPKVRVGGRTGAVRYKWAFLAKCHVSQQAPAPSADAAAGNHGIFGCIFCAAEAKQRGWKLGAADSTAASIRSGVTSKDDSGADTPIFHGVESFMQHLEEAHRSEDGWPSVDMRKRAKVICGRAAETVGPKEDWDILFVPVAEIGAS